MSIYLEYSWRSAEACGWQVRWYPLDEVHWWLHVPPKEKDLEQPCCSVNHLLNGIMHTYLSGWLTMVHVPKAAPYPRASYKRKGMITHTTVCKRWYFTRLKRKIDEIECHMAEKAPGNGIQESSQSPIPNTCMWVSLMWQLSPEHTFAYQVDLPAHWGMATFALNFMPGSFFYLLVLHSHWWKLIGSWALLNSYGWTERCLTIVSFSDMNSSLHGHNQLSS